MRSILKASLVGYKRQPCPDHLCGEACVMESTEERDRVSWWGLRTALRRQASELNFEGQIELSQVDKGKGTSRREPEQKDGDGQVPDQWFSTWLHTKITHGALKTDGRPGPAPEILM